MKIVCPNYQDPQSDYRWLVRDEQDPPEKALAYKRVEATVVRFITSGYGEIGFGSSIVARCLTAEGFDPEIKVRPKKSVLEFTGTCFQKKGTGGKVNEASTVNSCDALELSPHGTIIATTT